MRQQDVLLLCLIINNKEYRNKSKTFLANILKISRASINESIKRLSDVNLILTGLKGVKLYPHRSNSIDYLKECVPHLFFNEKEILKVAQYTLDNWKANQEFFSIKDI